MILICILLLNGLGAAIIGSVAPSLLLSQIIFYIFGLGLFYLFSKIDFRIYSSLAPFVYLLSVIFLIVTLIVGLESRGSVRWISIGSFRLQFSEILKPFLSAAIASFILLRSRGFSGFLKVLGLLFIPTFLVFKQPDLGSSLVYLAGFLAMIFVSSIPLSYIFSLVLSGLIIIPVGWGFLADYQKKRIFGFLNPQFDPLGTSYNAIQAVIAVGSGLLFGRGLGQGTQSHLLFLPEHHTDFIFASLAEEFGFVGAGFLLLIYFLLIWKIFSIALHCDNKLGTMLGVGLGTILFVQVLINVGMNLALFPITGITLPLVSYGGSSVLATAISLGIVQNIASLSKQEDSHIIGMS